MLRTLGLLATIAITACGSTQKRAAVAHPGKAAPSSLRICKAGDLTDCRGQCDRGEISSCLYLSDLYARGDKARKADPQAATQAAKRGRQLAQARCAANDGAACAASAQLKLMAIGDKQDFAGAAADAQRGCDAGSTMACFTLAALHQHGKGVAKNVARALRLYRQACQAGEGNACAQLGSMAATGDGVAKDRERALALWTKACKTGVANACAKVGTVYAQKNKPAEAMSYSAVACKAGSGRGCTNLGAMYLLGSGTKQDVKIGLQLTYRGCQLGDRVACQRLASLAAKAKAMEQDKGKSKAKKRRRRRRG
ncbi:MAG: sel1 repeat family protein [Deltaproteobacteria bacterium]|nr:sel1 repeat family protein [Deltaproteobacteria bacterium]